MAAGAFPFLLGREGATVSAPEGGIFCLLDWRVDDCEESNAAEREPGLLFSVETAAAAFRLRVEGAEGVVVGAGSAVSLAEGVPLVEGVVAGRPDERDAWRAEDLVILEDIEGQQGCVTSRSTAQAVAWETFGIG